MERGADLPLWKPGRSGRGRMRFSCLPGNMGVWPLSLEGGKAKAREGVLLSVEDGRASWNSSGPKLGTRAEYRSLVLSLSSIHPYQPDASFGSYIFAYLATVTVHVKSLLLSFPFYILYIYHRDG